ncbi:hypothetical protein [Vibrio metschnikovii]|uniref:hypothetical protein n=1 Tax=Vibrio metschnikovii TaxID=28172 RepID=UPI001C2F45FB|nr:hypothetical protein [Vibrio metschnikovii]
MKTLNLVPEEQEQALNHFIDDGLTRLKSNREFCGLSLSGFVDWMYEQDLPRKMMYGLTRNILTVQFEPMMSSHKLIALETYQEHFNELLEKYIEINKKKVIHTYRETINDQITEQQIAQFELRQIANLN